MIHIFDSLGLSFIEFASHIKESLAEEVFMLSEKQEEFFANNLPYYYFYHKIFKDFFTIKEVKKYMNISEKLYWKIIHKLEEFGLIELHGNDRVVLKIKKGITLRPGGLLQNAILKEIGFGFSEYLFDEEFAQKYQKFPLKNQEKYNSPYMRLYFGKIHPHHYRNLQQQLKLLHEEFVQTCIADRKYYSKEKLIDISWLQGLGVINGMDFLHFKE